MNKKIIIVLLSIFLISGLSFAQEAYNLTLKAGENFVSLPLIPQDPHIESILAPISAQVKDVWEFNPADANDPWKHYQPGAEGYSDLSQIDAGKGYWLNLKTDVILERTGTPAPENFLFNLKAGWNIIGWPYQYSQGITAALCALNSGTDYTQVSRFNPATKTQENFLNQPSDTWTTFEPGQAYYIYMLQNKTIRIGVSVPVDTAPPAGTITINAGAEYTNAALVTLTLSAQDSGSGMGTGARMQFSGDNLSWSAPESYTVSKFRTLAPGEGTKTVYVKYMDAAGNWSTAVSDTIILDLTPPVIIITSPEDGAVVETPQITLSGTVDGVSFSETVTLQNEGSNTITKTAVDDAGNSNSAAITVYLYSGAFIGPEGGEVSSVDGKVKVIIPPGALNSPELIRILPVANKDLENTAPAGSALLSVVECKPYGLVFNVPASIIYTLAQAEVPGTSLELGYYDKVQNKIFSTGQTSIIPIDGYTAVFSVSHFSTYAALKDLTPQSIPIGSGVRIPLPDLLTGSFGHSIALSLPAGRKGIQPSLGLNYRSGNALSWVGLGFSLNPGYIARSTRLGPPAYNDAVDTFYLITDAGTTELVNLIDNLYQAKVESGFTKFFKEADDSWKAAGKDGSILKFGQSTNAKETAAQGTFSWFVTKALDTNGNYVEYFYTKDQGKCYLSRIDYTGNEPTGFSPTNSVEFILENRNDISSSYISGSRIAVAKRLKEVRAKVNSELVWRYELEYADSQDTGRSLLKSVTQYAADGAGLPKQKFSYQSAK